MFSRAALGVCILFGLSVSTVGQPFNPRPGRQPPVIQFAPIQLQGTVAGVRPGMIAVSTAAGETWAVKVTGRTEIRVLGTAEPDVLRPGLYVRFFAPVDKRRSRVEQKVGKLTIFSPSKQIGRMPGVFYPGQEGDEAAPEPGTPPNGPEAPGPGRAAKAHNRKAPAERPMGPRSRTPGPPDKAPNVETFDIRARLTAVKGDWLTVYVRNPFFKPSLRIQLTDEPEIKLDVSEYSVAKPGDKVAALGRGIGAQAVQARQVRIELAEPLGGSGKRAKRPGPKRPPRRPRKGGHDRGSFEIAEEMESDKPGQGKQPPPAPKKDAPPEEKPPPSDQRGKQIVQFLQAKPEEIRGKPRLKLTLGKGDPATFAPSTDVGGKEVLAEFGLPDNVLKASGKLPVGEDGEPKEVKWQLWIYGPVKLLVDEADRVRYFAVTVDKKKPPE